MLDSWISSGQCFLLVYAINDKTSFSSLQSKYERIMKLKKNPTTSIVLVGNKCDLENKREVSKEEATKLASEWGVGFIETSALVKYLLRKK